VPTYEYRCRSCGHVFEIVQKMSDDPLVICPECGGELRKVFAPPAISFKGSGFYATDHGKKAKPAKDKEGATSKGSDDKGGATTGTSGEKSGERKDASKGAGSSKSSPSTDGSS
jgi:putative FmdB family regulatory protein